MKKGALWAIAELWSWIGMFIIIFIFLLLFKGCSAPTLHVVQNAQVQHLTERQEALALLEQPVVYRGQNVTLAYLISLGTTDGEFAKVSAAIQRVLLERVRLMRVGYGLVIVYPGRTLDFAPSTKVTLDTVYVPSVGGTNIRVDVSRALSLEEYQKAFLEAAKRGGSYVGGDGRTWVFWRQDISPVGTVGSWSEDGFPCETKAIGDKRSCLDGSVPTGPRGCFVQDEAFVLGNRPDSAACRSSGDGVVEVDTRRQFFVELSKAQIGDSATAPDGTVYVKWGHLCASSINPDCLYWTTKKFVESQCQDRPLVVDKLATPYPFGMCEGIAAGSGFGQQAFRIFEKEFVSQTELQRVLS